MAERYLFFPSENGDRVYTARDWTRMFRQLRTDGYMEGEEEELEVTQTSPASLGVRIGTGIAYIQGHMYQIYDVAEELMLSDADLNNPRIDRIVARVNYSDRRAEVVVREGDPATDPNPPELQQGSDYYELALAQVYVDTAVNSVSDSDITDERGEASKPRGVDDINEKTESHINDTNNPHSVTKSQLGLGNVVNEEQIPLSEKGASGGVAELDSNGGFAIPQIIGSSQEGSLYYDTNNEESKLRAYINGRTVNIFHTDSFIYDNGQENHPVYERSFGDSSSSSDYQENSDHIYVLVDNTSNTNRQSILAGTTHTIDISNYSSVRIKFEILDYIDGTSGLSQAICQISENRTPNDAADYVERSIDNLNSEEIGSVMTIILNTSTTYGDYYVQAGASSSEGGLIEMKIYEIELYY